MATGGEILIHHLLERGVQHLFMVPGESFLPVLDALHGERSIVPVTCRNESGAAMMAEATGKLTGRPGVAIVTRGPGAVNAMAGVYIADQDATPMVLLVGLPARAMLSKAAFQTIDLHGTFGAIARSCEVAMKADRIGGAVARAFAMALESRGPVILGLPEDVLSEDAVAGFAVEPLAQKTAQPPTDGELRQIADLLANAARPIVIAGSSDWSQSTNRALERFASRFDLPVVAAFRRQDHFDNRHTSYVGHAGLGMDPTLKSALRASDLVIAIGTRLGDVTTDGFTLFQPGETGQSLVHISGAHTEAVEVLALLDATRVRPVWTAWRRNLRAAYETTLQTHAPGDALQLGDIVACLSARLPEDAIVCNGAGNYAAFLHRHFVYKSYGTQLAPVSGSMGYGLPAAIAAKLAFPERTVVAFAGDGCFQMVSHELATAVQCGVAIIVIIANNGSLATIRMHQERRYPGRVIATSLVNPDFARLAQSYGADGEHVTTADEFQAALARGMQARGPYVIDIAVDLEMIAPGQSIAGLRTGPETDARRG